LRKWGVAGADIIYAQSGRTNKETGGRFNPTVPKQCMLSLDLWPLMVSAINFRALDRDNRIFNQRHWQTSLVHDESMMGVGRQRSMQQELGAFLMVFHW
jgi:hypothetical protein